MRRVLAFAAIVESVTGLVLIYNALIAAYLAYLGTGGAYAGILLWPGAALHAVVALLLVWTWRSARRV